jgi:hypothetical protein
MRPDVPEQFCVHEAIPHSHHRRGGGWRARARRGGWRRGGVRGLVAEPAESGADPRKVREPRRLAGKLRDAFTAERQKENVLRLDPGKRQELANPILDQAVADGRVPAKARDRILKRVASR